MVVGRMLALLVRAPARFYRRRRASAAVARASWLAGLNARTPSSCGTAWHALRARVLHRDSCIDGRLRAGRAPCICS
jgi:hypothetical protein